jgi:predicted dinucleotide-binding enzyme
MSNLITFQHPAAEIGVLGTGRMGVRLAAMFARAGRSVVLGSRDQRRAEQVVRELSIPHLAAGSYDEAVAAEAVLPALFIRDGAFEILSRYSAELAGKLLIDISNPYNDDYSDFILPWDTSAAEELQRRLPAAKVVGAYKNVFSAVFDEPLFLGTPSDVFIMGDDEPAKEAFLRIAEGTPFRYLDAGGLINARAIERMTMVTGALGRRLGSYPRMNWRLLG